MDKDNLLDAAIDDVVIYEEKQESDLHVGDVVTFRDGQVGQYAVSSIIEMESGYGEEKYRYELTVIDESIDLLSLPIDEPDNYESSQLEFQYHDTQWEEYFTESVRNGLPAWRGDLYNYFMFFHEYEHVSLEPDAPVNRHEMEEYKDHTVPPLRMQHILRSHSIFARVNDVVKSSQNKKIIAEAIGINVYDINKLRYNFQDKIISRNATNTTYSKKIKNQVIPKFTEEEEIFANLIDKLDTSNNGIKDHYPYELTNLQIMDAIREAYHNAKKIGSKKITVSNNSTDEDLDAPNIGKQLYEGYSGKYDLVIQFIYNFDHDFIETAYPIRMNDNTKKH